MCHPNSAPVMITHLFSCLIIILTLKRILNPSLGMCKGYKKPGNLISNLKCVVESNPRINTELLMVIHPDNSPNTDTLNQINMCILPVYQFS